MIELNEAVKSARQKRPRPNDLKKYISCWKEKDVLGSEIVDSFVMILRTRGCAWGLSSGCSMCGYINDSARESVGEEDLIYQFQEAMKKYSGEKIVKIYTSGSFFDEEEIPVSVQDKILNVLQEKTEKVIVETRPEFVKTERLKGINKIEIAMGLESANDFVLENSINKGFKLDDYVKAATTINDLGIGVKTYLLIKPPFLTEKEAIEDTISSAEKISKYTQTISFNPINIQKFTLVERLWRNREYRPPWLWSVLEVLKNTSKLQGNRLMSSPTAGGTKKGAHNCGKCDKNILEAIREFSLTQDINHIEELHCECKDHWQYALATENIAKTQGDLLRLV
ncbi:MAG: archaeosine biosynthesis radical SAM protein RaSEA [Thermoplasmata archaeon]|nr:MAG: archaeosine biosynthesis radical SAM protein RaSEA [Thermoplasmata archaeon]